MTIPFDVTQPPPRPPTLEAAQAVIDVLWDTLGQLQARILELAEQLRLTSRHSSKPPSSEGPAVERRYPEWQRRGRRRGGQPGHPGVNRALVPLTEVDQVYPCWPGERCACGGEIRVADVPCERHQVFELPPSGRTGSSSSATAGSVPAVASGGRESCRPGYRTVSSARG